MFDIEDKRILQLDTYGSQDRQTPDKVSQSFQIDREGAATLLKLIQDAFPGLSAKAEHPLSRILPTMPT